MGERLYQSTGVDMLPEEWLAWRGQNMTNIPYSVQCFEPSGPNWKWVAMLVLGVLAMSILISVTCVKMGWCEEYSDTAIVNAIYRIEGGAKAQYAYGIRSVRYSDISEARRICFNTVRNNRKRFAKQTKYADFLAFLQSRYCPTAGRLSKAEQKLNGHWLKNLRNQLARI